MNKKTEISWDGKAEAARMKSAEMSDKNLTMIVDQGSRAYLEAIEATRELHRRQKAIQEKAWEEQMDALDDQAITAARRASTAVRILQDMEQDGNDQAAINLIQGE